MKGLHSHQVWGCALLLLSWVLPMEPRPVPAVSLSSTGAYGEDTIECVDCNPLVFGRPLNINTAPVDQLVALPSIGPSKADAIVALREQEGAFSTVADLQKVRGIGPKTVQKLSGYITVD